MLLISSVTAVRPIMVAEFVCLHLVKKYHFQHKVSRYSGGPNFKIMHVYILHYTVVHNKDGKVDMAHKII